MVVGNVRASHRRCAHVCRCRIQRCGSLRCRCWLAAIDERPGVYKCLHLILCGCVAGWVGCMIVQLVIVGDCRHMSGKRIMCAAANCGTQFAPTRKGCGGRQKVQPEYLQCGQELLKGGAEVGDWICMTHRNALQLRVATKGLDLDITVRHVSHCRAYRTDVFNCE